MKGDAGLGVGPGGHKAVGENDSERCGGDGDAGGGAACGPAGRGASPARDPVGQRDQEPGEGEGRDQVAVTGVLGDEHVLHEDGGRGESQRTQRCERCGIE